MQNQQLRVLLINVIVLQVHYLNTCIHAAAGSSCHDNRGCCCAGQEGEPYQSH